MQLSYRKVTQDDYEYIHTIRNQDVKELHDQRIRDQEQGDLCYYLFSVAEIPVAMALITFKNSHAWHQYPAIEDLYVKESYRHQGIAKEILRILELILIDDGYKTSCLDVELHEEWLMKFYASFGYIEISRPHRYTYMINGAEKTETVAYFEKEL